MHCTCCIVYRLIICPDELCSSSKVHLHQAKFVESHAHKFCHHFVLMYGHQAAATLPIDADIKKESAESD